MQPRPASISIWQPWYDVLALMAGTLKQCLIASRWGHSAGDCDGQFSGAAWADRAESENNALDHAFPQGGPGRG